MIQGTTSDAGKSILTTAFCRMLARKSIAVAPFKPQNMALNSSVTADGGEIGRAQAVQAEACYLEPNVLMNPILLKPNSDMGSQVIVKGKALGNMKAHAYHKFKPKLLHDVIDSFNQLVQQFEAVLIEGAGSPAEINLRENDIANMGFAEVVDCPVIIVADIDRGGVFAHLYGTYALLSEQEKQRVVGFVINRFRGDLGLLESGSSWLEDKTSVPVIAVIPYIENLHIEAEDSISRSQRNQKIENEITVAVINYPRISNHTDFDVLRLHPQVNCELLKESEEFNGADLIILPGSKNVQDDLRWLKEKGWERVISKHLCYGGKLLGICGGFQMLGQEILDPDAIESMKGSSSGLGYLDMRTRLTASKTLRNVTGHHVNNSGCSVKGYEIHAGVSTGEALERPLFNLTDEDGHQFFDGAQDDHGSVIGSYVHGLLDQPQFLTHVLNWAGAVSTESFNYPEFRQQQIDRLADAVEQAFPLNQLKLLVGLKKPLDRPS
ncbi:MAG: cobyric acid synthase CobQ [Pseudomonadales bacterium]|nr:cobyric acid synthase CobQ [Pseudomonadales bacterium]